MGTVKPCCPACASVQIRAQRWNCLSLPDISIYRWPKGLGNIPSSSLNTIKRHHLLCPCRQFSSSSQLIISAATYSTHPLQSQRKFPLSLGCFFFFQSLYSTPKLLLAFSWSTASGTILCVCFDKNKITLFMKFMKHLSPSFLRKFCLLI